MINFKNVNRDGDHLFKKQVNELNQVCDEASRNIEKFVKTAFADFKDISEQYSDMNKNLGGLLPERPIIEDPSKSEGPRPKH